MVVHLRCRAQSAYKLTTFFRKFRESFSHSGLGEIVKKAQLQLTVPSLLQRQVGSIFVNSSDKALSGSCDEISIAYVTIGPIA
jgi:hypothetical protein